MKKIYFYSIVLLTAVVFLIITGFTSEDGPVGKSHKDIIKFNHSAHAEVAECGSCHTTVPEATDLSTNLLPTMDDCAMCHDTEDMDNCKLCHYEEVYEPFPEMKSELMFNHKFHLEDQKMECVECHKGFDKVKYGFEAEQTNPPMAKCYTCHNETSKAVATTTSCNACHISTVNLKPQNHRTASFFKNHKFSASAADANCAMCHEDSFCESCHVSTNRINESNTADDFFTPYSPYKYIDNTKEQKITRVHDLNYRYSHGIDAKGKTTECQTCHEVETFCAECHASKGGDFAMEGIMPTSHFSQNFVMIGIGSGGGVHAKLAKRDIESCAACHDTQGADPNCIMCHVDPDGIKGTNPKTHDADFMSGNEGNWHDDAGAVCFNCHTDVNAHPGGIPGQGFCGYCHQ